MAYIYVWLFWHTCLLLLCEVDDGRADFLGDVEAFQQSHTDVLGHGVQRSDVAWDLRRTISALHFVGLDRLHCCQKKNMSITWGTLWSFLHSPYRRVISKEKLETENGLTTLSNLWIQNDGTSVNIGIQPMIFVKMDRKRWNKEEKKTLFQQQCFYTLSWKATWQDILIL